MSYQYAVCLASTKTEGANSELAAYQNWSQSFRRRLTNESGVDSLVPFLNLLLDEDNLNEQEATCREVVKLARHLIVVGSTRFACSRLVADLVHGFLSSDDRRIIFVVVAGKTSEVLDMYHAERQQVSRLWVLSPKNNGCLDEIAAFAGNILLGTVKDIEKVEEQNFRSLDVGESWCTGLSSAEVRVTSSGSDHAPLGAPEGVTFSTFAPSTIVTGQTFIIDLWAHTSRQNDLVLKEAESVGRDRKLGVRAGVQISQGSVLGLLLEIPTMHIRDPIESLSWNGVPTNASFVVNVPDNAVLGQHAAIIRITAAGIPVAKLSFTIQVGSKTSSRASLVPTMVKQMRTAFASYSSRDRAEVLARVQGMKKIRPELEVFLDVLSLRSGQNWDAQLNRYIPSRDVFFLFWSQHAKQSAEVEKEWRMALRVRGLDYIDPVPLCDPKESPPPAELQSLHFNDLYLSYINASGGKRESNRWWKLW